LSRIAGLTQSHDFGVGEAGGLSVPSADDRSRLVHDHSADGGVRTDIAERPSRKR